MINGSSSLSIPLSPRPIVVREKHSSYLFWVPLCILFFFAFIALGWQVFFPFSSSQFSTVKAQNQINSKSPKLNLGKYEVCEWAEIEMNSHVPIYIDGKKNGFYDSKEDILIEGVLCGTDQTVVLALDSDGLHGSISFDGTTEYIISAIDVKNSEIRNVELDVPNYVETEKTNQVSEKWSEYMDKQNGRRSMLQLQPGSVDVHIHLDIDKDMVDTYGSVFAAARYGVELIAVINRDAYFDLGFNLKVTSINVRTDAYLSPTADPGAYLTELEKIPRPVNVNLLHSLTTRRLGGGVAYVGGLYTSTYCYGVSGSLQGQFSSWDRIVVAHELGHNFGSEHTHNYVPQIDTCGTSCPANPIGTIMSYCHLCSGGLGNIRFEWASRVEERLLNAHASSSNSLATRTECTNLIDNPDVGVPFYFKGDECLTIETSQCATCETNTCTLDSVWTFDGSRILSAQNTNYCWSTDCVTISLQVCDNTPSQQFSFQGSEIISGNCGPVKYASNLAGFSGPTSINTWCHPDETPNQGSQCDRTLVPLTCNQIHTGSTVTDCDGERRFSFVSPGGPVTISTCDSAFDTMLSIQTESRIVKRGDDEGTCGTRTVLENLNLDQGVEHFIVLVGYGGATGEYRMELSCESADPEPTSQPTLNPINLQPTSTMDPTLCPTSNPTTDPTTTLSPTSQPTNIPTEDPTKQPTTLSPTFQPTIVSTEEPTWEPTFDPTTTLSPTFQPTNIPTEDPTKKPTTLSPTFQPTIVSTKEPTREPTFNPTIASTKNPTVRPTTQPTTSTSPTNIPAQEPTVDLTTTISPTFNPTIVSTKNPTGKPTTHPISTNSPTYQPTDNPTLQPTVHLTITLPPTLEPSTLNPTFTPSSVLQTLNPTTEPSINCISDSVEIQCGQVLTGSTVNACDGQRRFRFVPESDSRITVSTCDSEFDTILAFYNSYTISTFSDDSQQCGLQSILEDVSVEAQREYDILLTGFDNQVGSYRIELTCESEIDSTLEPSCEDEFIQVQCGEVLSGSTVGSCHGEQLFIFTAETESTTISSCGSQFDTMLGLREQSGQVVAFTDDTQECGRQSILDDSSLTIGNMYTVVLSGFGGEVGTYTISITCSNPTLDPTNEPTSLTSQISYGCLFGCEASYTSCHWEHVLDQPCTRDSNCDFHVCQSFCDDNSHCLYFFQNNQGICYLYDGCSRARLTTHPGFNRQKLPHGHTTESPGSGTPIFTDLYGGLDAPSRTTCHGEGHLSTVCRQNRSCSTYQCEDFCARESECNFYFQNVRGICILYHTCQRTRWSSYEGITRVRT